MKKILAAMVVAALAVWGSGCGQTVNPTVSGTSFQRVNTDKIFSVKYYEDQQVLSVLLNEEGGKDYQDVPPEVVEGFRTAEDKDAYFEEKIDGQFKVEDW